jgi:hypothetical protein
MGVFQNNLLAGAAAAASAGGGGFYSHQIEQSCRFDASASSRLYRTFGTSSDATKMTISWWMKYDIIPAYQQIFSKAGGYGAGNGASITFEDSLGGYSDVMTLYGMKGSSGGGSGSNTYPANAFRDVSGWTHCHYKMDTSKSGMTGNNAKVVLHINGVNATFVSTNEPSGNFDNFNTNGDEHSIGNGNGNTQGNIYLAEFIFLDGQYEDYTSFGEFKNGVWIPIDYSGTYGNNGFRLKFENASDLGNDSSGNNNDFTASGLGTDHQVLDSPTFGS